MNQLQRYLLLFLLGLQTAWAQQPYYDDVDLSLTGQDLFLELQDKISSYNVNFTYGDIRDEVKITDENPENNQDVLLVYGYNDGDGNCTTDRSRDKDEFGGGGCEYNREHVFARSNANPEMGSVDNSSTGIGADPHNVRPSDQAMNNNKGNRKMAAGSGNAGTAGSNWYPGDEWKGDVARMMMYMYTRYGDRCLPSLNGTGSLQSGTQMLEVYLQWNAEDPVSELEDQRNPRLEVIYGNRNPFIDNPYLATLIWGGPQAEDRWEIFGISDLDRSTLAIYPNPAQDRLWFQTDTAINSTLIYDLSGRLLETHRNPQGSIPIQGLPAGTYLIELQSAQSRSIQQLIIE